MPSSMLCAKHNLCDMGRASAVSKAALFKLRHYPQSDTRCTTAGHTMAVIRVYDDAGNVIDTYGHKGDFKEHPG